MDAKTELPPLTAEQEHILDLHRNTADNLLIEAFAGTGKTTMLELIIEQCKGNVLFLAFNTRIRDEIEERLANKLDLGWPLPPVKIKTINGFGHTVWAAVTGRKLVLKDDKLKNILRTLISEIDREDARKAWEEYYDIVAAAKLAKCLGYVPEGKFPHAKRLISADALYARLDTQLTTIGRRLLDITLVHSIKEAYRGTIDYNDQVYMPALFGATFPKFPTVLVDELQDLSPVDLEMLYHLRRSRIIAVGDDAQSIYQFRGAAQGGMASFQERHNATRATLSVSFRCPSAIVRNQRRVPGMCWLREGGHVEELNRLNGGTLPNECTIVCRNNAPLFVMAMRLLVAGRSVTVHGSEIGPRILGIMRKFGTDSMPQEMVLNEINDWLEQKLLKESKTASDVAECMRVFAGYGEDLGQALGYAKDLFEQEGTITLLTGHKAKGLEWSIVYHLDPWLIKDGEQEENLRYVIQTRAKEEYYEIRSDDITWVKHAPIPE